MPPMGLSFTEINSLSKEPAALYPLMDIPALSEITDDERRTWKHQDELAARLRRSAYYIIEETKSKELPRFSDKYRLDANTRPKLKESDLNKQFFPPQIWDIYFNPKKRRKDDPSKKKKKKPALNLDALESAEADGAPGSPSSSQEDKASGDEVEGEVDDYEDEDDDDYNDNHFDGGDGDDDMGGGGDEGGGGDWD